MITITDSAATRINDLIIDENKPGLKLRIFVQGGGCSGFQYGFMFDDEVNEDDMLVEKDPVSIVVDSMSFQYLDGSVVDFKEEIMGSNFVINNPNAQSKCGCGSSFSV
jgi:iron-sulfur cluster insertion protein